MNCRRVIGWSPISRRLLELLGFLLSTNSYWSPNKTGTSPRLSPRQCTGAGSDFIHYPDFDTPLFRGGLPLMITKAQSERHPSSVNPLGLLTSHKQIPLRTLTSPYLTLRLAPNPLFRVSSHYPLLHPPTNSFWYRIGTETNLRMTDCNRNLSHVHTSAQGAIRIRIRRGGNCVV
jgi:hypothetical protein